MAEWVVYRTSTHTCVYTGIEAATREEALAAFLDGEGKVQPERERASKWRLAAVEARHDAGTAGSPVSPPP